MKINKEMVIGRPPDASYSTSKQWVILVTRAKVRYTTIGLPAVTLLLSFLPIFLSGTPSPLKLHIIWWKREKQNAHLGLLTILPCWQTFKLNININTGRSMIISLSFHARNIRFVLQERWHPSRFPVDRLTLFCWRAFKPAFLLQVDCHHINFTFKPLRWWWFQILNGHCESVTSARFWFSPVCLWTKSEYLRFIVLSLTVLTPADQPSHSPDSSWFISISLILCVLWRKFWE